MVNLKEKKRKKRVMEKLFFYDLYQITFRSSFDAIPKSSISMLHQLKSRPINTLRQLKFVLNSNLQPSINLPIRKPSSRPHMDYTSSDALTKLLG